MRGPYVPNAFGQLASRKPSAEDPATLHMIYDLDGNLIAEADAATGVTVREYIWLGARPVAVVDGVDTATPVLMHVHVDHLDRPVLMTNAAGAVVWRVRYRPFGEIYSLSGTASLEARFPGQWFMAETGLAYNWHRWYAAGLGRYTQPDPLGLVDGPSRYAYALGSPLMYTDPTGLSILPDWMSDLLGDRPDNPDACFVPNDHDPEKCKKNWDGIKKRIGRMRSRYSDMLVDPHGLFDGPKEGLGSYPGHRQAYNDERRGLRNDIDKASAEGCAIPPDALDWMAKDAPNAPLGR